MSTTKDKLLGWNINKQIASADDFETHCQQLYDNHRLKSEADRIDELADPRKIHLGLFLDAVPVGFEIYAGSYRGLADSILEGRHITVRQSRNTRNLAISIDLLDEDTVRELLYLDPTSPMLKPQVPKSEPRHVEDKMVQLGAMIRSTITYKPDKFQAHNLCARIFAEFLDIHPFLDGNGHVARFMLKSLMENFGFEVSKEWTIHRRPYGQLMSIGLDNYHKNPMILSSHLKRWFKSSDLD